MELNAQNPVDTSMFQSIFTQNQAIISFHLHVYSAKVTEHMLEKSRVVHCGNGERSFHIFYYMFAGLSQYEIEHFYLSRPEHYR